MSAVMEQQDVAVERELVRIGDRLVTVDLDVAGGLTLGGSCTHIDAGQTRGRGSRRRCQRYRGRRGARGEEGGDVTQFHSGPLSWHYRNCTFSFKQRT